MVMAAADRMRALRQRRRAVGLREIRLVVPDARDSSVRARVMRAVAALPLDGEREAMEWIEAVSEFDEAG